LAIKIKTILQKKQVVTYFVTIFLISLLLIQPGFAVNIDRLYEASVKAEADKTEKQLTLEAFTQVLIKVSGRSEIPSLPIYNDLLKNSEQAISQFRYDYKTLPSSILIPDNVDKTSETPKPEKEKWFWVRFNADSIDTLLQEAQIPIWGKVRPETLIWFSQEIKGKRSLVSQYEEPELYSIFKQQAEARGISLLFPFLDLQDQSNISANDIWGNFNDAVLLASRRYQAQSTLTSRIFQEPSGLWVSHWNLLVLGETQSWSIRDEQFEKVLISGINDLADKLSRQFTQVAQEGEDIGLMIQINNIIDYKDFQTVDDYLRQLATVKSLTLVQLQQDKLIYAINYISSKESLIQEIRLDNILNSVELSGASDSSNETNKPYKSVNLDNLEQQHTENAPQESAQGKNMPASQTQSTTPPVKPEILELHPELEYWFIR